MKLSAEQKKFLRDYFSLSESDFKAMTKDDWHKIKMECMVIEGIEYEKAEINNSCVSDKGVIAEQLVDMDYSELLFIDHKIVKGNPKKGIKTMFVASQSYYERRKPKGKEK